MPAVVELEQRLLVDHVARDVQPIRPVVGVDGEGAAAEEQVLYQVVPGRSEACSAVTNRCQVREPVPAVERA